LTVNTGGSLAPTGTGTLTANFVPVSGGAAPTANGAIAYDSTANKFKVGVNGTTNTLALLSGGNVFTTGKQTLAASAAAFAALNFPNTGAVPTTPVLGDLWLTTGDNHLQFQTGTGLKSLAFTDDTLSNNQLNGTYTNAVTLNNAGNSFTGSGAGLTALNGSNISTGTVAAARLPLATSATVGVASAPTCAAGTHYSSVNGSGALVCSADSVTTSLAFTNITSGTNITAAMVVGSGASLAPGGTGIVTANSLSNSLLANGNQSASGTTTSTAYTSTLTGGTAASTSVTVSGPHTALVTITTNCSSSAVNGTPTACMASFAISGTTTLAASDSRAAGVHITAGSGGNSAQVSDYSGGGTYLVTLNSGTNTFAANYRALGGGTATFATSSIIVQVF
jgi:hypothetical protein